MKRSILFLAVASMILTGCTSVEVYDEHPDHTGAIGFESVINKPTRDGGAVSGDLDGTNFNKFMVYGYYTKDNSFTPVQIFGGVEVSKTENEWKYDEFHVRYWIPGYKYSFYAYSCGDIALADDKGKPAFDLTEENPVLKINDYLCNKDHQHDLVVAKNTGILAKESGENGQVSLPFNHALCKAKAKFTTDLPEGYRIYISNVNITSFDDKANYNVETGVWSSHKENENSIVNLAVSANSYVENKKITVDDQQVQDYEETEEAFLIPKAYNSGESVKLHFTLNIKKVTTGADDSETETQIIERRMVGTWAPQWVKGNRYQYNIKLTGSSAGIEPIVFAATQQIGDAEWVDTNDVHMEFGVETQPGSGD